MGLDLITVQHAACDPDQSQSLRVCTTTTTDTDTARLSLFILSRHIYVPSTLPGTSTFSSRRMAPIEPRLPVKNRLDSFWLSERDVELKAMRTTAEMPTAADVVIVGSGLSGAMMAYHLYRQAREQGRRIRVVMLEADETCGSATARNGEYACPLSLSRSPPPLCVVVES